MNKRLLKCFLLPVFLFLNFTTAAAQNYDINRISRSVVQIHNPNSSGSGILMFEGDEILVLTNRHVVEGHDRFVIHTLDDVNAPAEPAYLAELKHYSPDYDVAVVRIVSDMNENPVYPGDLKCGDAPAGDCITELQFEENLENILRGDEVALLGYPSIGDNELVYSKGIISSIKYDEYQNRRMPIWFRTNADMAPGNSGGLAINGTGKIIGIPTYVRTEDRTGGRLGSILSAGAIQAALESDGVLSSWRELSDEADELDYTLEPEYGATTLSAGFLPDPHTVTVIAGGSQNASYLGEDCIGYAARAPDYRFEWNGQSEFLSIYFAADNPDHDGTMLVNAPDGSWHCNDDAYGETLDPEVWLSSPMEGQYDLWVGSYHENEYISGSLQISERTENQPESVTVSPLNWELDPFFGETELQAGFLPDPFRVDVEAGGAVDVSNYDLGTDCIGYAAEAPDYRLHWTGETAQLSILFISAETDQDATLLVNAPDGSWYCNDDITAGTYNPGIGLSLPMEGQYDIWVGSYREDSFVSGELFVTETVE